MVVESWGGDIFRFRYEDIFTIEDGVVTMVFGVESAQGRSVP